MLDHAVDALRAFLFFTAGIAARSAYDGSRWWFRRKG